MISLSSLKTAFQNYSYFYGSAPIGTSLPYLVATSPSTDNFTADNKVYSIKNECQIEYYSLSKSETGEAGIESILDSLGVVWNKTESYDETQSFYLVIYSFWR